MGLETGERKREGKQTLNSPNPRPGTYIKNTVRVLKLGHADLAAEREAEDVVRHVEAVLLFFIVGQELCSLTIRIFSKRLQFQFH